MHRSQKQWLPPPLLPGGGFHRNGGTHGPDGEGLGAVMPTPGVGTPAETGRGDTTGVTFGGVACAGTNFGLVVERAAGFVGTLTFGVDFGIRAEDVLGVGGGMTATIDGSADAGGSSGVGVDVAVTAAAL